MNTGGPAFPIHGTGMFHEPITKTQGMTLLDWMAGQALVGLLSNPDPMPWDKVHPVAYDHAEAMLAEKARREADHSGDANKMVPDPFAETTLRRLAADVLPADIKDAADEQTLVWCAEQVRTRVNTLAEINRELVEALKACEYAFSKFAPQEESAYGMAWIKVRATLAKAKGIV